MDGYGWLVFIVSFLRVESLSLLI